MSAKTIQKQNIKDKFNPFLSFDTKRSNNVFFKKNQEHISSFLLSFLIMADSAFKDNEKQKEKFLEFIEKSTSYSFYDLMDESKLIPIIELHPEWKESISKLSQLLKNHFSSFFNEQEYDNQTFFINSSPDMIRSQFYFGNLQGNTFSTILSQLDYFNEKTPSKNQKMTTRVNRTNFQFIFWLFKNKYIDEKTFLAWNEEQNQYDLENPTKIIKNVENRLKNQGIYNEYPTQFHVPLSSYRNIYLNHFISPNTIAYFLKQNTTSFEESLFYDFLKTSYNVFSISNLSFSNLKNNLNFNKINPISPLMNNFNFEQNIFDYNILAIMFSAISKIVLQELDFYNSIFNDTISQQKTMEDFIKHIDPNKIQGKFIEEITKKISTSNWESIKLDNLKFTEVPSLELFFDELIEQTNSINFKTLKAINSLTLKFWLVNFYKSPQLIEKYRKILNDEKLKESKELKEVQTLIEILDFFSQWSKDWTKFPENALPNLPDTLTNFKEEFEKNIKNVSEFCSKKQSLSIDDLQQMAVHSFTLRDFKDSPLFPYLIDQYFLTPFFKNLGNNWSIFKEESKPFFKQIYTPKITKINFGYMPYSRESANIFKLKLPAETFFNSTINNNRYKYITILNHLKNEQNLKLKSYSKHPDFVPIDATEFIDFLPDQKQNQKFDNAKTFLKQITLDSDQQKIIEESLNKKSIIIEGPAGTGKTQTLNNIIKALAAANLKVLIVTNNEPALEIVQNRFTNNIKFSHSLNDFFENQISSNPNFKSNEFSNIQIKWFDNIPKSNEIFLNSINEQYRVSSTAPKNIIFASLSKETNDVKLYKNSNKYNYDVILFDEASLIPYNKAALLFSQAPVKIITGDSKQLPPTFSKTDDEYAKENSVRNIDLLKWAKENTNFKQLNLKNNYRSEMKDLLSFSNKFVYNDQLNSLNKNLSFDPTKLGYGINFEYVDGNFVNQSNKKEIYRAIQKTTSRISQNIINNSNDSILILTGNKEQAKQMKISLNIWINMIKSVIENNNQDQLTPEQVWEQFFKQKKHPEIFDLFSYIITPQIAPIVEQALKSNLDFLALSGSLQKMLNIFSKTINFFLENQDELDKTISIKDIESMQGAEADHVILSLTYGPNKNGTIIHRFGEFSSDSVLNFINVIGTRSIKSFTLLSSIQPEQLLDEKLNENEKMFKNWIQFHKDYDVQQKHSTLNIDSNPTQYTEQIKQYFPQKETKSYEINDVHFDAVISSKNSHFVELLIKVLPKEKQNEQQEFWTTKMNLFSKRGYKIILVDPSEIDRLKYYSRKINIKKM